MTVRKKSMKDEWLVEIGKRHPVSLAMVQCHGDHLSENALREIFREMSPKLKVHTLLWDWVTLSWDWVTWLWDWVTLLWEWATLLWVGSHCSGSGSHCSGLGHIALGVGHIALGLGHITLGLGHMTLGVGHIALVLGLVRDIFLWDWVWSGTHCCGIGSGQEHIAVGLGLVMNTLL